MSQTCASCGTFKNDGTRWAFAEDLRQCISRGRRNTRDIFIRDVKVRALISWDGMHFGASDLQVCWDDFAWQVQHFVWPGITFSWQAQYFRQVDCKNRKTHWYEAVSSARNFPFLKEVSQNSFVFDVVLTSKDEEVSQNCFVFDVVEFEKRRRLAELFRFWHC